jgi:multimeric flavodoxin WrbA
MTTALALICTLKPSPEKSSTELIADQVLESLAEHGVTGTSLRIVDHDVRPGVDTDMGDGDAWPGIRQQVLDADILVIATPIWMGHASSVAHRVLERLDAELSETQADGRPSLFDKIAVAAIVGNEDGAHAISADLFQALNDVGYTIPAQGVTYWDGQAMKDVDYQDLPSTPKETASATATLAANAAHLAELLAAKGYPKGE